MGGNPAPRAPAPLVWVDGRLVPGPAPAATGPGCYSTARYADGRLRHGRAVAGRLARDARALGLGELEAGAVLDALRALGEAVFGRGEGVVRAEASSGPGGSPRLVVTTRPIGPEPPRWTARLARTTHPGPGPGAGIKHTVHEAIAAARAELAAGDADEVFLLDAAGRLVEGSRTSPVVVRADGRALTPPLARGGVAGVARALALRRVRELREGDVERATLVAAREIVALNAVRGARPVVALDGVPVGDGRSGPMAARLREALDAEE